MSIATQRAKERENRTLDVKVMVKTVKHGRLKCHGRTSGGLAGYPGPDVQKLVRFCPPGARCPAWGPDIRLGGPDVRPEARMSGPTIMDRDLDFETQFGAEMDDFGGKI